jgi:MbtH protein
MVITVSNPFEDEDALYRILQNEEGQCSLWPATLAIPDGWATVHDADSRSACIAYVEASWTDMRPLSLVRSALNDRSGG